MAQFAAIYRPRDRAVRLIDRNTGEWLTIPEGEVQPLIEAMAAAFDIPRVSGVLLAELPDRFGLSLP